MKNDNQCDAARKSMVKVLFPGRGMALSYYNDRFDLKAGDLVYVSGKLEGVRGKVTDVTYNFRVRLSDYQRVVALIDSHVKGQFFSLGSCFVTFDAAAIPAGRVLPWFIAPMDDEEFVSGSDDSSFPLSDPDGLKVSPAIAQRGEAYYKEGKVAYLSLDGSRGCAVVMGSEAYEVDFTFRNGEISQLSCSCSCGFNCKHEVAALWLLREALAVIEEKYSSLYAESGSFAMIRKDILFSHAIENNEDAGITL